MSYDIESRVSSADCPVPPPAAGDADGQRPDPF